jgi:hypothetical protein
MPAIRATTEREPATRVGAQLALDVRGKRAVVLLPGLGEKRLEVLGDQLVEQRLFGSVALMDAPPAVDGRPGDVGHDRFSTASTGP